MIVRSFSIHTHANFAATSFPGGTASKKSPGQPRATAKYGSVPPVVTPDTRTGNIPKPTVRRSLFGSS